MNFNFWTIWRFYPINFHFQRNRGFGLNNGVDQSNRLPMADLVQVFGSLEAYIPICTDGICPTDSMSWNYYWNPLPINTQRFNPLNYFDPRLDMTLKALLVNMFGFGGESGIDTRTIDNIWTFISNDSTIYNKTKAAIADEDMVTCITANDDWSGERKCHVFNVIYHAYMTWNGFYEELNDSDFIESLGWNVITQEDLFKLDVLDTGATRLIYNPLRDWHCANNWQAIAQAGFQNGSGLLTNDSMDCLVFSVDMNFPADPILKLFLFFENRKKFKGFHVCSMSQFQWTDSNGDEHVWAGPRKIDFISDGSNCDVLGPFPIKDDDDTDDGDNGDDNDYCIQAIGFPSDCEYQCDSQTEEGFQIDAFMQASDWLTASI